MRALDLYCCSGGASEGLRRAGFEPHGVDHEPQAEYPFAFTRANVLGLSLDFLRAFSFIWASPPCQFATAYKRRPDHVREALNLIPETRELLIASGVPYVIENVEGARAHLRDPITLCGSMFRLDVRRHRLFESSLSLSPPPCNHDAWTNSYPGATNRAKNSRKTVEVGVYRIPLATQQKAMGLVRSLPKLSQAIPPAYGEWLGLQARLHLLTQQRSAT